MDPTSRASLVQANVECIPVKPAAPFYVGLDGGRCNSHPTRISAESIPAGTPLNAVPHRHRARPHRRESGDVGLVLDILEEEEPVHRSLQ